MSAPHVVVRVYVEVDGARRWEGLGETLTEALVYLGQAVSDLGGGRPPEEIEAVHAAIGHQPWVTAEITSTARWWNPWSWGTVKIVLTQKMRAMPEAPVFGNDLPAYRAFPTESGE